MINIDSYKGISPGKIIARELRKHAISQRSIASKIGIHSQTLNAVITGHRKLTVDMALKIERFLGLEEGFLLILQTYYNISEYKRTSINYNNIAPNIRKILFWDTDFEKIDWNLQKETVIRRVMERGSASEKEEIIRFYKLHKTH